MNPSDGSASRVGIALLAVGYPVSVVALVRLLPILRERRPRWFAVMATGLSCVVIGWALLRKPVPAAINGIGLAALVAAWVWRGRRRR